MEWDEMIPLGRQDIQRHMEILNSRFPDEGVKKSNSSCRSRQLTNI